MYARGLPRHDCPSVLLSLLLPPAPSLAPSGQVRCWTIQAGTLAPGAAGVIHSDFERGFIKAEVGFGWVGVRGWVGSCVSAKCV